MIEKELSNIELEMSFLAHFLYFIFDFFDQKCTSKMAKKTKIFFYHPIPISHLASRMYPHERLSDFGGVGARPRKAEL